MTLEKGKIDGAGAQNAMQDEFAAGDVEAVPESVWPAIVELPDAQIRIVGLGPGPVESLTLAAWRALTTAPRLVLRTARHPGVAALPASVRYTTFDALYEQHATFAAVYTQIAQEVVALGQEPGGVVYGVPGHPWVGEATTPLILDAAQAAGLTCAVIDGPSFVEPCFAAVGVDLMDGSQVVDAMLLAHQHHPRLDPGLPLMVAQLYSRAVAGDVKLTLLNAYPDEHPVTVLQAAGNRIPSVETVPLYALDHRTEFDHLTSLYVPPLPSGSSFSHLQAIIAHLRAPEGCPWDREQTLDSLKQDLLGECAEVLEAIDAEIDGEDNSEHISEELGDLLLIVLMLVQIATEEGRFRLGDVTQAIVDKLIRRHPHVFGAVEVADVDEIVSNWDAIKAAEKEAKGETARGPLDGVPAHLPALEKARVLQIKAEKAGMLTRANVADSLTELAAWRARWAKAAPEAVAAEVGELLWGVVALAQTHGVNAEDALRTRAGVFVRGASPPEKSGGETDT